MQTILKPIWNFLLVFQRTIMVLASILIIIGLVSTVILRYIFQTDLFGLEELIIIPAFWMYFMGASYGTYNNSHITADITNVYVKSNKVKLWLKTIGSVISLGLVAIFTYWSLNYILWSFNSGAKSNVWDYPLYIPQSAILVGFLFMTFYTAIALLGNVKKVITNQQGD